VAESESAYTEKACSVCGPCLFVLIQSSDTSGGALGDVIVAALQELLRVLFEPIAELIETHGSGVVKAVVHTPNPNAVFAAPTNAPWVELYEYYWEAIIPLTLFLYGLSIGLVIFFESTSHLFGSYHRARLKRRAFAGLLGILMWWWLAALSLQLINQLTSYLVPDLSNVTLFQTLSFSAMGVLGLVFALSVDLVLFVLIALIYFIRQLVLYLFVLMMPLLIVLWIPGVGPLTLVSGFMRRLAGFYVPFLFMTVPVALLFRLGDILGQSFELSLGGFGLWLTALVIPLVAVLSPFVLVWQAGAIFFIADRAAHRISAQRGRDRMDRVREGGAATAHGGQNFARGVRDEPAVRQDGQYYLDPGASRAHAAGSRLRHTTNRLTHRFRDRGGPGGGSDGSRTGTVGERRNDEFEGLRSRGGRRSGKGDEQTREEER
jgi:hypothetical protein